MHPFATHHLVALMVEATAMVVQRQKLEVWFPLALAGAQKRKTSGRRLPEGKFDRSHVLSTCSGSYPDQTAYHSMAKAESSKAARIRSQADNHTTAKAKKVKHIGKTSAENVKVLQPEHEDEDGQSDEDEDEDEDDLDDLDLSDGTVNMDSSDDEAGGVDEFEGLDQQDQEESDDDLEDITNRKSAQTQSQ